MKEVNIKSFSFSLDILKSFWVVELITNNLFWWGEGGLNEMELFIVLSHFCLPVEHLVETTNFPLVRGDKEQF